MGIKPRGTSSLSYIHMKLNKKHQRDNLSFFIFTLLRGWNYKCALHFMTHFFFSYLLKVSLALYLRHKAPGNTKTLLLDNHNILQRSTMPEAVHVTVTLNNSLSLEPHKTPDIAHCKYSIYLRNRLHGVANSLTCLMTQEE